MKFIHSGDWHLGKIVNEFSMLEEQKYILNKLKEIIKDEKPDALVIAGDLYDRSVPPVEAVELLDETLCEILNDLNTPILIIAGNHDSSQRLSFGNSILNKSGLYIEGVFKSDIQKVMLEDEYGKVSFYLVPYVDPREARIVFEDEKISTHDDVMKKITQMIQEDIKPQERCVIAAHGYISMMVESKGNMDFDEVAIDESGERGGLQISKSERPLSIGGTDLISAEYFKSFNYSALGHLHNPQKVGSDNIRYSGSLLKYSFSEAHHKKGVYLVEIDGDGNTTSEFKELIPKKDLRVIKGPLKNLIDPIVYKKENVDDFVFAILTDEEELMDPISKLRAVYPNIMGLTRESIAQKENSKTSAASGYKNKSKLMLFEEFYEAISGKELSHEKLELMKKVIEEVEREEK